MRLFSAIVIGVAALAVSIGVLETSTALAHTSPEVTHVISQPKLKERNVPTGLDPSLRIQAAVPLTDPDLDIFLDCVNCPDGVDTNDDGIVDASWEASGQGRVRRDRGPFKGQALLNTGESNMVFAFKKIERTFRDENGAPFGLVMSGRAQVTDSEGTEKLHFTAVAIRSTQASERLKWDIRGLGVPLEFEANGQLTFTER